MRDIMAVPDAGDDTELRPTGYMPSFLPTLVDRNLIDLDRWFHEAPA